MVTDKIKELETARARLAELETEVASELVRELKELPARYGFADVASFVKAITAAAGKRRGRKAKPGSAKKTRKRAKITDATRAQVKKLAEDGKTGNEIAKAVGISLPSVQNIKKALGLVKKKK